MIGTEMLFEDCTIRHFNMSNTSAAINLHSSNPVIRHCLFLENAGAAIGGGANIQNSPQILYNEFISNGTANTNRPQINLGPGATDTLKIIGNYIEGEFEMAGGIAVANLMSVGHTTALVRDNVVVNNRYGYAGMGSQITSIVQNNHFIDNNIQGQPMLGGSGLNFMGGITNTAIIRGNVITGNLWGITIQNNARPNLGEEDNELTGFNVIEENGNSGSIYGLYNNTPEAIFAQFNHWGTGDEGEAAGYIIDQDDDPSLGPVTYLPMWVPENLMYSFVLEAQHNDDLDEDVHAIIDQEEQTISLSVPAGTDLSAVIPTIHLSTYATVDPGSGQTVDLTEALTFTVTSRHGEERSYMATAGTEGPELFTVTFLAEIHLSGFDPGQHYIVLTGTMTDWGEPGTDPELEMELTSEDPLVYSKTFQLEEGPYEYKYFSDLIGEGWHGGEWHGEPNRAVEVTSDSVWNDLVQGWNYSTVHFHVTDTGGQEIQQAVITFGGETYDPGHYIIEWIPYDTYEYVVEKDGYHSVEGEVEASGYTNVEVVMSPDDVGIVDSKNIFFRVYPNPADEWLFVESVEPLVEVGLFDLLGQKVYTAKVGHHSWQIDCSPFVAGIYFLQITTSCSKETRRVILR